MLSWYYCPGTYDFPRNIVNFDYTFEQNVILHSRFHPCLGTPHHQPRSLQSRNPSKGRRSEEVCQSPTWPCLSSSWSRKRPQNACWYTYSRYHLTWSLLVKIWETRWWTETYWMVRPRLFKNIECFPLSWGTCRCRKVPEFLNLLPGLVSTVIPARSSSRMNS